MHCLLIGNFGVGNLGDEALKEYFFSTFPVRWTVVSSMPVADSEVPRLPGGIRSLFALRWIKTLRVLRQCDAVVFGGGSLFTDTESLYACFLWWMHVVVASVYGKPIHMAFQGIGPFHTGVGEWLARDALRRAASISVRDGASYNRCFSLVPNKKIVQSFDPVFCLIKNKNLDVRSQNILVLIPRKSSGGKFAKIALDSAQSRSWDAIHVLSMQPDDPKESRYCSKLVEDLGLKASLWRIRLLDELVSALRPAHLVVSERYHGALAARALGKDLRIVSQKPGDKLDALDIVLLDVLTLIRSGEGALREALGIEQKA